MVCGFFGRIVPSDATTQSQPAIRENPKNEIASFRGLAPRNLAISKPASQPEIDSGSTA
jgi:hypothetical protein